ncbi:hypothetical protein ABPG72_013736 [Tetrahymena utriculariae]
MNFIFSYQVMNKQNLLVIFNKQAYLCFNYTYQFLATQFTSHFYINIIDTNFQTLFNLHIIQYFLSRCSCAPIILKSLPPNFFGIWIHLYLQMYQYYLVIVFFILASPVSYKFFIISIKYLERTFESGLLWNQKNLLCQQISSKNLQRSSFQQKSKCSQLYLISRALPYFKALEANLQFQTFKSNFHFKALICKFILNFRSIYIRIIVNIQ